MYIIFGNITSNLNINNRIINLIYYYIDIIIISQVVHSGFSLVFFNGEGVSAEAQPCASCSAGRCICLLAMFSCFRRCRRSLPPL